MKATRSAMATVSHENKPSDANIEDLINKVCCKFSTQLEEKFAKFSSKLDEVSSTLTNLNKLVSSNKDAIVSLDINYDNLN